MTVGFGISARLLLRAVTCSGCVSAGPAVMPVRLTVCTPESSGIAAGSAIGSSVGGSVLTTINVKFCVAAGVTPLAAVIVSG